MFEFKTREEYFEYKEDWKKRYKEARKDWHELRKCRKKFTWQYRPKNITHVKRRTKVGPNPNYDPVKYELTGWKVRKRIGDLLEERKKSKILAGQQRQKRLDKEAA